MMRQRFFLFSLLALFAAMFSVPASAALPPRPAGPISDGANLIPDQQEAELDARLREYNARTGNSVIVATVPSLDGETIERYSTQLYETWGIGGAERDAGVLLLVAPNEREVRIEVGYGLHAYITDILSGRIIRNEITPRFKQGDYAGGIVAGVDAMVTQLDRSPADAAAIAEAAAAAEKERRTTDGPTIIGAAFWVVIIIFFIFIFSRGRGRRGRRSSGMGGAVGNIILWEVLSAAARAATDNDWDGGGGGGFGGGGGGGFGGFGGGMSGGGGASGSW